MDARFNLVVSAEYSIYNTIFKIIRIRPPLGKLTQASLMDRRTYLVHCLAIVLRFVPSMEECLQALVDMLPPRIRLLGCSKQGSQSFYNLLLEFDLQGIHSCSSHVDRLILSSSRRMFVVGKGLSFQNCGKC